MVAPPGFEMPPELHDEVHDGNIPGLSWALAESAVKLGRDSPGLMQTLQRTAAMAASTSAGASTRAGTSTFGAGSSSPNVIVLDTDEEESDGVDWDNL